MDVERKWKIKSSANGVIEFEFPSWTSFMDSVSQNVDLNMYIWRGHRCSNWILESTLDRLMNRYGVAVDKKQSFLKTHLEQFKYAVRGRRGSNPMQLDDENDWWALGQHHGLATPLLDWTTSPYVAAYFAFIGVGESQTPNRAIYALHTVVIKDKAKELLLKENIEKMKKLTEPMKTRLTGEGEKTQSRLISVLAGYGPQKKVEREISIFRPFSDENQRLVSQGGLFTRVSLNSTIQNWVETAFKGSNEDYVLLKMLIPNSERETCLKTLNRMNINHLTLFPDLSGASKFCNLFAEIENY